MARKSSHKSSGRRSPKSYPQAVGTARMSREGFIFVDVEGREDDIYVKATRTKNALNGDLVKVAILKAGGRGKRCEGEVIQILERSSKPFIGILHFVGAQAWVLMQSRNMPYDIAVDQQQALEMGGKTGMKAAVVVDRWERNEISPWGHVTDVLGMPGENDTEMHAILAEFGLPYRFEKEVEDAADKISEKITSKDLKGRKDFRDTFTFTIDPTDAKDFDDALSFKALSNGNYEIGVHIADVSYYVTPDSIVDKEAQARATSVYLVDRTVPMLPEKLCNKLCSLRPDEDKLTFSTVFEITPKAEVKKQWIGRTVIRSNARLDYEQAQEIILGGQNPSQELTEAIQKLNAIASILRKNRFKNGAINFERPEMKVDIDENGKPVGVHQEISNESHWLIEEFMLLANRTVAELAASKKAKTFVYRIHDEPNGEKIQGLRDFAGNFGYKMGETGSGKQISKALTNLLESAKDKPEFGALEMLALRSMAKAKYSTDNIGHYGLAFTFYTHFTSPIRRYPDTMVHRLLAMYLDGKDSQSKDYYEQQCVHCSEREQLAADAERASTKYKLIEFMQDKIGQEFEGHISGLTEWGMYVEIEPTKIEGMVPLRTIKSDFFYFDEEHYRLVGKRKHKVYRLGDSVRIKVSATNLEQKLLDYELIEKTHK